VKWQCYANNAGGTIRGMSPFFRNLVLGGLICLGSACPVCSQKTAGATAEVDFSDDPCGNPMIESDLWYSIEGNVTSVEDGRTILIALADDHHLLRVHVAGIVLEHRRSSSDRAKAHVREMALDKPVGVMVNPSNWLGFEKRPKEVTGVVHLTEGVPSDVGLSLLAKGLARSKQPRPYTMSRHTFCQYRRAESEAQSKKLGLWQ
jgi:endonuclease YncB( thermonuclease family)